LCGTDSVDPGGCSEGEVCASIPTAPFSTQLCIYAVGEEECPTDLGYDERSVWHRDFTDDRDCTECTCLINGECTGALHLFDTQTCQGPLVDGTVALGGSCVQVDVAIEGALVAEFEPDATCIANGGALQGDADPLSPVTLCCRR
jgi:hypothetical protein